MNNLTVIQILKAHMEEVTADLTSTAAYESPRRFLLGANWRELQFQPRGVFFDFGLGYKAVQDQLVVSTPGGGF